MSRSPGRLFVAGGIALALGAVVVALVVDLGTGPTPTAVQISGLHRDLLLVAVPIAVAVEAALVYAVWRFRDNEDPTPTPENRTLELTWTAATALVLIFVGVAAYHVLAQPAVTADPGTDPGEAIQVDMTAHQWYWSVTYPREGVTIQEADRVVLPANRTVRITVRSADVIHSLHVPALGLKQDAIPGQLNVVETRVTRPGEYHLYCAEYCGRGHAYMEATVAVVPPEEYQEWLRGRGNTNPSSTTNTAEST